MESEPTIAVDEPSPKKLKKNGSPKIKYGKGSRKRSMVWEHFTPVEVDKGAKARASCNWCGAEYACDTTSNVDNASSNNGIITFLKRRAKDRKTTILGHEFLHVRCCAHILNLIVNEGLKDIDVSIMRVRNIVKFVRSSPSRFAKFRSCVGMEGIASKVVPCLDVATRWNSTYFMLKRALIYEGAFNRMEDEDSHKIRVSIQEDELGESSHGCPTSDDWLMVRLYVKVLQMFYDATLQFSGSLYVTCNSFLGEMVAIQSGIARLCVNDDPLLTALASGMSRKFEKYWGKFEKINFLLLFAAILDPRHKMRYVSFCFKHVYASIDVDDMMLKIKKEMTRVYEWYENNSSHNVQKQVGESSSTKNVDALDEDCGMNFREAMKLKFKQQLVEEANMVSKSELERYLMEKCENDIDNFDVLGWWMANSTKYQILSQIARDVLAIPVSTVSSESAFSTGGRILDPYRTSLSPKVAEALICAQNWLRHPSQISLRDHLDEVEQLESVLMEAMNEDSSVIDL